VALQDESVFVAELTTAGRKSGLSRTVELRLVYLDGRFYASASKVETKHWCRNLLKIPSVEVKANNQRFSCVAKRLTDEKLRLRILTLRDSPALLDRVVFEMTPQK
jgi:deazaflavin-dependent oxidoreductase (nitroreductase family)